MRWTVCLATIALALPVGASAQQFNSDNYLTMPHGTATFVVTHGQRNSTILTSYSLARNWEFFIGANLFWEDESTDQTDHFSTTLYAKYMFIENASKTGGFAVMGGLGGNPAYYERGEITNSFRTYWAAAPVTLPFVKNLVLFDLMPGFTVDADRDGSHNTTWSFTHSTRVAVYGIVPKSAIVGEVYGAVGEGPTTAEYKAGLRWEPNQSFALAGTYGSSLYGDRGPGFEVGFLLFTPRFLCKGGC